MNLFEFLGMILIITGLIHTDVNIWMRLIVLVFGVILSVGLGEMVKKEEK